MRLVFQEASRNALSLQSLIEFYGTANRLCEQEYGIMAQESFMEIRLQENESYTNRHELLLFVKLISTEELPDFSSARLKWESLGKHYNWELKGILKDDADLPNAIDGNFLKDDWLELKIP